MSLVFTVLPPCDSKMSESDSLQTLTRQKEGISHGPCLSLLHECMGRVGGEDLQPE